VSERLAIFGGTFDPIHFGHLALAEEVCWQLGVARVFFVPAARQPLKAWKHVAPADARLEMVQLATVDNPSFAVCDLEIRRGGPSYTIDTVMSLREEFPTAEWSFVAGADVLSDLPRWHAIGRLLELCRFAIVTRPGHPVDLDQLYTALPSARGRVETVGNLRLEISSTDIRDRLSRGAPTRYQMPDAVIDYIREHGLYRARA
jgi:nicotinate-nucleotide adenylyltransferase